MATIIYAVEYFHFQYLKHLHFIPSPTPGLWRWDCGGGITKTGIEAGQAGVGGSINGPSCSITEQLIESFLVDHRMRTG